MTGDLSLTVGGGTPIDPSNRRDAGETRLPPLRRPLPEKPTITTTENFLETADNMRSRAPEGTVYKSIGDGISRQLTGYNKAEIKQSFQRAWQKDKQLGRILGSLKMSIRCVGFTVGTLISLTGRIATLPVAVGLGLAGGVLQFLFTPLKTFKKPRSVLQNTMITGIIGGVAVGSCISIIGMKIRKTMMGIKLDRNESGQKESLFDRTVEDNTIPSMIGAGIATGVACLYPAMWQIPFRKTE